MDETGDAFLYCNALAKVAAERHGVVFQYGVTINGLNIENGLVRSVATDRGDIEADGFVMALGSFSAIHMANLGIRLPGFIR